MNVLYKQGCFTGFSCVGLGAWLVVESQGGGGGASCVGAPRVKYLGYTSNGHLFLSTFCAGGGGGNVTFGVYVVPLHLIRSMPLSRSLSKHDAARAVMTSHEY